MRQLASGVYSQDPREPLEELFNLDSENLVWKEGTRLLHVVNPFKSLPESFSDKYQRLAFESLRVAKECAASQIDVKLVSVQYPEDRIAVPQFLSTKSDLTRSVQDIGTFEFYRKLPLLFDIIENGVMEEDDREFVIYTNADINVLPQFYLVVNWYLSNGYDSLIINRRELRKYGGNRRLVPLMISDYGKGHPGFDCFIFPRDVVRKFARSNACVGAGAVMRSLLYNLVAYSSRLLILRDVHLTYHLGEDRAWTDPVLQDYVKFNETEAESVIAKLSMDARARHDLQWFSEAQGRSFKVPIRSGDPIPPCVSRLGRLRRLLLDKYVINPTR